MKSRIIIFAPYPRDEAPSQRFRFEQYLDRLEKDGYEIVYSSFLSEKEWRVLYKEGNYLEKFTGVWKSFFRRWNTLFKLKKSDILFVHREIAHIGPPIFEWIIAKGLRRKYIYDFDDAIWLPNYSQVNSKIQGLKMYWKVKYCIKWAHTVNAGNDFLADYAKKINVNVNVVPTTIDLENYHNLLTDYSRLPITVGWTGTHTTMRYLDEIVPILQDLEKQYDFVFQVISNKAPDFNLKSLKFVKWNKSTEIKDLATIQIGVMPLTEDQWSEGKCGFKALQYMALGIPVIISPVGVNSKIVKNEENGYLVSSSEEWKKRLIELLEDENLRKRIGEAGRKTILDNYSVTANYQKYIASIEGLKKV